MKIEVRHSCADFNSYRAARVKSLFNVESGCDFKLDAELPIDDGGWSIGVVVGPSGSGKTSIGRRIFGDRAFYKPTRWPKDAPIIDAIAPGAPFDEVPTALASVGLGTVPAWLRPYSVLSNGERFRADLARIVAEKPDRVVFDEFSSVVDRQIARVGALAFAKAWRRTEGRAVLLSCHYDILDWLAPCWVYDTSTGAFTRGWVRRRPPIELEIRRTDWSFWPLFQPHHYLKLPRMIGGQCYVGFVDGRPVAHVGVSTSYTGLGVEARAARLVVMPEWQGIGIGTRFLNAVCGLQLAGRGRLRGRRLTTLFHTSHPRLAAALRRDDKWRQVSARLFGESKGKSAASIRRSRSKSGATQMVAGYGGHFRAVQGFRFYGDE